MKRILNGLLLLALGISLSACKEEVTLNVDSQLKEGITVLIGESVDVTSYSITTSDGAGVNYSSDDSSIVTISPLGIITGISEGATKIKITSQGDPNVFEEVAILVRKKINLSSSVDEISLREGDTFLTEITSNDNVTFESSDLNIFTVDDNGQIFAKSEGQATLSVTSTYDSEKSLTIQVTVLPEIQINVPKHNLVMIVGDESTLDVSSNDEVTYLSSDNNIVFVDEFGTISAVGYGQASITITSVNNPDKTEVVNVSVFKQTEAIEIEGEQLLVVGMESDLSINASPVGSLEDVTWASLNEDIVMVDGSGHIQALATGEAMIVATSTLDDSITAVFTINVIDVLVVSQNAEIGDVFDYSGVELHFGQQLFSDINSALQKAKDGTLIYVDNGTFNEDIDITNTGLELQANEGVTYTGHISVQADDVHISGFTFTLDASISNIEGIHHFTFDYNTITNLNDGAIAFLHLSGIQSVTIEHNTFSNFNKDAINIERFTTGSIQIRFNHISDVHNAINIVAITEYDMTTELTIWWNQIEHVDTAFVMDLSYDGHTPKDIESIVRFNTISDAQTNVNQIVQSQTDYTLNYWGDTPLDTNKFINVDAYYLQGAFEEEQLIPSIDIYNPDLPVFIIIDNPIDEIMIGESHTYEYTILPYELADHKVRFITGNPDLVQIDNTGTITPIRSGDAYIQIRSAMNSSIRVQNDFTVVTTPGIELIPSNVYNNIVVGDTFTLTALPFPVSYENEEVHFVSSDDTIASIDQTGLVTTHSSGFVTFTASLVSDPTVQQTFTTVVYDSLDANNIMDYLTMNQITYTTPHEWTAYGFTYNYYDKRYESVSRYYFDNLTINQDKMLPVSYGIRPGEPMSPLPDGLPQYNPDNVYWIVVHDTANTSTGANALSHANYLYNAALAGTTLWASWHFTVDDTYIYQHLPTNERGYHAGDGSTSPGEGSYLGGGNHNGIGIEMAVNEDGDMMRTWQRTAKLAVELLIEYNLPVDHQKFHHDFSGKDCPNTLRNAGLVPLFHEFVQVEYTMATQFPGASITFVSNNPEILDNHGRIIAMPDEAMTISYTITVTYNQETTTRTFYSYIPGTIH